RIYAPRIYAPRIYAPRIYAPRIYAPRIYAPDSYVPALESDPDFRDAFSAAQNQTLLAVSANTGTQSELVSAPTGNTDGYFYVRVQGHTDQAFNATSSFTLNRTISGNPACVGLTDYSSSATLPPTRAGARTVIVTDTNKLGLTPGSDDYVAYRASLDRLAAATDGAVVDVRDSARVRALQAQVDGHPRCPFATNLVARAVKEIVDSYRNTNSKYVVIAGGDDVIPFFRYPDVSGLGQESQFLPPLNSNTAPGASLTEDQVLSQDAYGSSTEVTIGGATLPLPDLAVGRLVKTPGEITAVIDNYLGLTGGTLPAPTSSLVTGYDFLADAADRVNAEFSGALPGGIHHTLLAPSGAPRATSWTGADLEQSLLGSHHDLVYLAGHFSANDTLAADFATTFDADLLDPTLNPGKLLNTVVLSAGCHSGYNIVDGAAVTGVTNTVDWTQRMAQQKAVLIGGTGYQYGDTDFLEYSERLYLDIARRLREGQVGGPRTPVAVGNALTLAKQDYLASLSTLTGIEQKAVLQATLYGLPMTGFDAPGRAPLGNDASRATPTPVTSGPGQTLGLATDDLPVTTTTDRGTKTADTAATGVGLPGTLSWLNGADGVSVQPGAPALPKQIVDVSVPGQVLRGVGFRGGDYTDTAGLLPLTGAPAIEDSTANTTFESSAFFPQRLMTPNYFGALGVSGRTSLVVTPAQYRSDSEGVFTNTERRYSGLDVRLFYSGGASAAYGQNQPALAAPPSIGSVRGTVRNGVVTFSARVTGDPSAGVQQVWVTWTGSGDDSGHGRWAPVDLGQDPADSTHWTGTLPLPAGQSSGGMRFLVQAANGVGAVGLDTADGDGYRVTPEGVDTAVVHLSTSAPTADSPLGVRARVEDAPGGAAVAGRTVRFTVSQAGQTLFVYASATVADGTAELRLPTGESVPPGRFTVTADIVDTAGDVVSSDRIQTLVTALTYSVSSPSVDEGNSGTRGLVFRVSLSQAARVDLGLDAAITGGTATAGADYAAPDLTRGLTVPAGQTSVDVTVPVTGDTAIELSETVVLRVIAPTGSPMDSVAVSGVGTITNDDFYAFGGFLAPVDPQPVVNQVKAGQSVPVKFSLGGYRGLAVFLTGSPTSSPSGCSQAAVVDEIESTTTANQGLTYSATTDTYSYVWKTSTAWRGTCRVLSLAFADGTIRKATFTFK
ncbi:MAG: PxKF domain-containing protein, partial [Nocardioides sp.]